jgi:hypothetical protein
VLESSSGVPSTLHAEAKQPSEMRSANEHGAWLNMDA